jgi:phenylalanyl-tRNA synthetase beta chain
MKISYQWLNQYLTDTVSIEEAAALLTSTGLETEGLAVWESHRGGLKGVVTAEVVSCEKHPDADKLSVCEVNIGAAESLNIVCGAPNVQAGQKVLVACVGAVLFFHGKEEGLVIRKAKIRGVASEGMICAEDELGLGTSHDGIMVLPAETPVGIPAASYFQVTTDSVFEIGLTPNRTDAMSHIGVARDLAACVAFRSHQNIALKVPEILKVEPGADLPVSIQIMEHQGCKRYAGITLAGASVGESPVWLRHRLEAIGVKTINSVVDVTNYVLHEIGHPLHAFDYDNLSGQKILVKTLPVDTPFVTLDGVTRKLTDADLMICDAERPLCIAGVYGGLDSGVTANTTNIFLESAWFDPVSVRRSARHHGFNTDASFRFERGADPNIAPFALWRAVNLICDITGAQVASPMVDVGEFAETPWQCQVQLRLKVLDTVAGQHITHAEVLKILSLLEFDVLNSDSPEIMSLAVPGYRADVTREIDVIEEILRIYGFDRIEIPESIPVAFPVTSNVRAQILKTNVAGWLIHNGFNEVWNNSLSSSALPLATGWVGEIMDPVKILNPLSQELDIMRTTMLFGLLDNARHNLNRKNADFRLFEFGQVYAGRLACDPDASVTERYDETPVLAMLMTGNRTHETWMHPSAPVGFYDLKSVLIQMMRLAGVTPEMPEPVSYSANPLLTPCICYVINEKVIVRSGQVSLAAIKQFGIKQDLWYAEICWRSLTDMFQNRRFVAAPLPRFPDVRRDLSLILNQDTDFASIRKTIFHVAPAMVHEVTLFDVYEGKSLPAQKKSYAVAIILRDLSKTLQDHEIDGVMQQIIQALKHRLGAVLR